jgi:hypothetical protein
LTHWTVNYILCASEGEFLTSQQILAAGPSAHVAEVPDILNVEVTWHGGKPSTCGHEALLLVRGREIGENSVSDLVAATVERAISSLHDVECVIADVIGNCSVVPDVCRLAPRKKKATGCQISNYCTNSTMYSAFT